MSGLLEFRRPVRANDRKSPPDPVWRLFLAMGVAHYYLPTFVGKFCG